MVSLFGLGHPWGSYFFYENIFYNGLTNLSSMDFLFHVPLF
jgi:hypothetical protein